MVWRLGRTGTDDKGDRRSYVVLTSFVTPHRDMKIMQESGSSATDFVMQNTLEGCIRNKRNNGQRSIYGGVFGGVQKDYL